MGGKTETRGRRKGERDKEEEGAVAKPSAKVSLFDFLEDKLPNFNGKYDLKFAFVYLIEKLYLQRKIYKVKIYTRGSVID